MENKANCYTYTTDHIDTTYHINDHLTDTNSNGAQYINTGCAYLLPCGICERTGKQCPKYWHYESPLTWDKFTCSTNISDSNTSGQTDIDLKYTTKSSYTNENCEDIIDFNKIK